MCAARLLKYGIYGVRGPVQYDRARSGLEWWAQCRRPEENEKNETIGFHWDKDEQLNTAVADLFVQPQFATVTYLTDCGAPTIVVPLRCAPLPCLVHSAAWWVRPPHPIISALTMHSDQHQAVRRRYWRAFRLQRGGGARARDPH